MLRTCAAGAGLILAGFHVWLLGQQVWTGRLEAASSVRWLLALGLVAALVALHRRGSALFGRRAVALWVLAAVLHGPSLAAPETPAAQLAEASGAAMQMAGAALGMALAITIGRMSRRWRPAVDVDAAAPWLVPVSGPTRPAFGDGFAPRPPPRA